MKKLYSNLGVQPENGSLLLTMYFAFFSSGAMSVILGALLPYIKDAYALDYTQSGMLLSAHQIGNLCAVILAGVLPGLIGQKPSALLLGSGMMIGMASMTLSSNPTLLLVAFVFTGISRGNWSNVCNTVIGGVSENKTAALNILHAVFAVGALLSPLIVLGSIDLVGWGWQGAARSIAVFGGMVLILVALSRLPGRATKTERAQTGVTRAVLCSASFWLTTGILFFYLGAEASIIGWFVTYFSEAGILSPTASSLTPTLLWSMMMLGRLTCARYSKRFPRYKLVLGMGILFTVFFVIMLVSQSSAMSIVSLFGIGFFMAGIYPTTFSTMKDLSSTLANGLCIGIATLGAILMPSIVGAVADARGLAGGVAVILSCCVGMLVLLTICLLRSRVQE